MKPTTARIAPFLNAEGRIRQLPVKQTTRAAVLYYLAQKFESGRDYTEKEVNALCDRWHTFGDYFLLRRGLVDEGFLLREPNGSRYWRSETREEGGNPVGSA